MVFDVLGLQINLMVLKAVGLEVFDQNKSTLLIPYTLGQKLTVP